MQQLVDRLTRTRANYWLEPALDSALAWALLVEGLRRHVPWPLAALLFLAGVFAFSFMEYVVHRWVFHGPLQTFARGHAAHHREPRGYDALPFFVPALVLAAVIGLCVPWAGPGDAYVLASGIAFGYVAYGICHFVIHRRRFRHPLLRGWAARHHIHHHHPGRNFGVTSALWDALLGTRYVRLRSHSAASARSAADTSTR
ncbi:MAG TPA: sterol desaturase family protein [Burkholderiales bacterium]|nr:sterol desaturase family protein [Burkholderiales bacterium]